MSARDSLAGIDRDLVLTKAPFPLAFAELATLLPPGRELYMDGS